ncbi:MAG: N-acetylmannosamine-6-phosphate 2-epimerase [Metamycoplasmataceae bacterium]
MINIKKQQFLDSIRNKLIVSCQAVDNEPLNNVEAITLVAKSVIEGGAEALRLSQKEHIKSIMKITDLPIIGLIKERYEDSDIVITPTLKEVKDLIEIGIKCIAIDATLRKRPKEDLEAIVRYIKENHPDIVLMADCSNEDDVKNAIKLNFDLIGTTLRGYTNETKNLSNISNNYEFIRTILKTSSIPIIAEGGIWEPIQVKELLEIGCFGVVVGSAITRPKDITHRFYSYLGRK